MAIMAAPWLVAILAIVGVWVVSSTHRFYVNYRNAARSGFPLVLCPINPQNPMFMILNAHLRPMLQRVLPTPIYDRFSLAAYGWEFRDKHAVHDRIGPVFILVTTGTNELWCADPAMAQILLTRRKDFVQLPQARTIMGLLGNNIIASDGETWARQRRLIAPNLNERISAVVWKESMAQAGQMADYMLHSQPEGISRKTVSSMRAIAINVLGQVGYGQPKPFKPIELPRDPNANMAYIDAIALVTEFVAVAAIVPNAVLSSRYMPLLMQTLAAAMRKLPGLTADMLDQERQKQKQREKTTSGDGRRENIMSMLVRLSDQAKQSGANGSSTTRTGTTSDLGAAVTAAHHLSEDEIAGNMFLVTGAGFDTTANTLSYAAVLLAAYPEKQAWVQEELDRVFGPPPGQDQDQGQARLETLDYASVYPQLARCLAFMFETLRLYPAVLHMSRSIETSTGPHTVTMHNTTHHLAGEYNVFVNNVGIQTAPTTWGADSDAFRPERWITTDDHGNETVITPARGTFLPWSGGPRVCPGQKMSQVEFVVVVATLLWRCSVRPVVRRDEGETAAQAEKRLLALAEDSQPRLTLQLINPDDLELQWVER